MALGRGYRDVGERHAAARAAEHQAAAAHISASGKFGREKKPGAENFEQRLNIFRRGDAAEQNDFAMRADLFGETAGVAFQRNEVTRFGCGNRGGGDGAEGILG